MAASSRLILSILCASPILRAGQAPFPVRCGTGQECPAGVGLWVLPPSPGHMPDQCTAFLVDADLALTNHHCIQKSARHEGAACAGARLLMPRIAGSPPDSAGCREVVALSPTSDRLDEPDWALVRLDRKLGRAPLALDRSGVRDLDTLLAWVAEPDWGSIAARERASAEIRAVECVASRRTDFFREPGMRVEFSHPLSRKVPLVSCPTWKGNSGSPALARRQDGSWAVKALLDRSAPAQALREAVRAGGVPLLDTALGEFAFATSIACIPWPAIQRLPAACRIDSNAESIASTRQKQREEIDSAIRSRVQSLGIPHARGRVLQSGVWTPFPRALGTRNSLPDALVVPLPSCGPLPDDTTWSTELLSVRFGFDRNLRWTFRFLSEDPRFPVRARCEGAESARSCRFEGTFPSGTFLLAADTLVRCSDRMAGARGR